MNQPALTPDEQFASVVAALRSEPGVSAPSDEPGTRHGFGADGLKVDGKLFAMVSGGRLVVKLPKMRVAALVAAGAGEQFDPRRDGRLMKEWLVVAPAASDRWLPLAREALAYVGTRA